MYKKKLLDINPRAFYIPCACHSLNLVLCDIENNSIKVKDFFGVVKRLYSLFANSIKIWDILRKNVKNLTLKQLSTTRWKVVFPLDIMESTKRADYIRDYKSY